jgi:diaminopimelate decarboxylase
MLEMIYNIKEMGLEITQLNLGGGFGINYLQDDPVFNIEEYAAILSGHSKRRPLNSES